MKERDAAPALDERRHADHEHHRHGNAGAQETDKAGGQAQPVSALDRSVMIGEHQVGQPERKSEADEGTSEIDAARGNALI